MLPAGQLQIHQSTRQVTTCFVIRTWKLTPHEVSLEGITRSSYGKFNCITINFEKTQHGINVKQIILTFDLPTILNGYNGLIQFVNIKMARVETH